MRIILLTVVAGATALATTPAAAQPWRPTHQVTSEVRQDINQLERQIARARQKGTISPRETAQLRRNANAVQRLYKRYERNGLTRAEVAQLERDVNRVRAELRLSRRNWDGRR